MQPLSKQDEEPSFVVTEAMLKPYPLPDIPGEWEKDEQELRADILSYSKHPKGSRLLTIQSDSRLGKAIVQSNPERYPYKGQLTIHEATVEKVIQQCTAMATLERMKKLF